jgi:hypothetical protein
MRTVIPRLQILMWIALLPLCGAAPENAIFPYTQENLSYTVNWPSGLSLGEAHLHARKAPEGWQFDLALDASVPGYRVSDRYHAIASPRLCSVEFGRDTTHGNRRSQEKTIFDYKKSIAKRVATGGGKGEIPISACPRDALTFLFFARSELGQGRVPADQTVLEGAAYQVRMEYIGTQAIKVADKPEQADRVQVSVKGPNSDVSFEAFFGRDRARTPLVIRCPFSLGIFSLELVR